MRDDYNSTRRVTCVVCERRFYDDCGDSFCSERCERLYERATIQCRCCDQEVGEDHLTNGLCEYCEEFLEGRGDNEE